MAYYDNIAVRRQCACKAHCSSEHGLDLVAFCGRYFKAARRGGRFSACEREGVFRFLECSEINAEGLGLFKKPGRIYVDFSFFGRSEAVGQQHCRNSCGYNQQQGYCVFGFYESFHGCRKIIPETILPEFIPNLRAEK